MNLADLAYPHRLRISRPPSRSRRPPSRLRRLGGHAPRRHRLSFRDDTPPRLAPLRCARAQRHVLPTPYPLTNCPPSSPQTSNAPTDPSRLTVHALAPSPLLAPLAQTRFSPTLTLLAAHPPALLTHLAAAYLAPPPLASTSASASSSSSPEKFWSVFLPLAARTHDVERLVFGAAGTGTGTAAGEGAGLGEGVGEGAAAQREFVVEVLVRGGGAASGTGAGVGVEGRRRAVERVLEGWSDAVGGPCVLAELDGLKTLFAVRRPGAVEVCRDSTYDRTDRSLIYGYLTRRKARVRTRHRTCRST